jgi:hypothetical protein
MGGGQLKDLPSVAALLARSGAYLITLRETGDHDGVKRAITMRETGDHDEAKRAITME